MFIVVHLRFATTRVPNVAEICRVLGICYAKAAKRSGNQRNQGPKETKDPKKPRRPKISSGDSKGLKDGFVDFQHPQNLFLAGVVIVPESLCQVNFGGRWQL